MNGDDLFDAGQWYPETASFAIDPFDAQPAPWRRHAAMSPMDRRFAGNAPSWPAAAPPPPAPAPEPAATPAPDAPDVKAVRLGISKPWIVVICVLVAVVLIVGIYLFWQFAIGNKSGDNNRSGGGAVPWGQKTAPPTEHDDDAHEEAPPPDPVVMLADPNDPNFVRER